MFDSRSKRPVKTSSLVQWLALLTSVFTLIAAGVGAYMAFKTSEGIYEVHLSVNSQLKEFKRLIKKDAFEEGVVEGERNIEGRGELDE